MKKISIVTGCFNEEEIIEKFHKKVLTEIKNIPNYDFELIYIDNNSSDKTYSKLLNIAKDNKFVKLILNNRNFGHIRSPYWAILQSTGDACIYLASDLQDPPELIPKFIKYWENGESLVWGQRIDTEKSKLDFFIRNLFYKFLNKVSEVNQIPNCTGFGLYDKKVIDILRQINDPYPYLRGLVVDLGFKVKTLEFKQRNREKGKTKNNIFTLYDIMMLAFINHSTFFIRAASFLGISLGLIAIFLSFITLVIKLLYWDILPLGYAPYLILTLFLNGLILFFIGVMGEYLKTIKGYVDKKPIVVEKARVNFDK